MQSLSSEHAVDYGASAIVESFSTKIDAFSIAETGMDSVRSGNGNRPSSFDF